MCYKQHKQQIMQYFAYLSNILHIWNGRIPDTVRTLYGIFFKALIREPLMLTWFFFLNHTILKFTKFFERNNFNSPKF